MSHAHYIFSDDNGPELYDYSYCEECGVIVDEDNYAVGNGYNCLCHSCAETPFEEQFNSNCVSCGKDICIQDGGEELCSICSEFGSQEAYEEYLEENDDIPF